MGNSDQVGPLITCQPQSAETVSPRLPSPAQFWGGMDHQDLEEGTEVTAEVLHLTVWGASPGKPSLSAGHQPAVSSADRPVRPFWIPFPPLTPGQMHAHGEGQSASPGGPPSWTSLESRERPTWVLVPPPGFQGICPGSRLSWHSQLHVHCS